MNVILVDFKEEFLDDKIQDFMKIKCFENNWIYGIYIVRITSFCTTVEPIYSGTGKNVRDGGVIQKLDTII